MILTQYPDEIIRTWRTSRLGCLYMNSFTIAATQEVEETSQLERITTLLSERPCNQTVGIYCYIQDRLKVVSTQRDSEAIALWKGMCDHFYRNILG